MAVLSRCFPAANQQVIAVIGSGGKSSLCQYLATGWRKMGKKVLMSTTTKILLPSNSQYERLVTGDFSQLAQAKAGITIAGVPMMQDQQQKLTMPDEALLTKAFSAYDQVLLEADGSRQLPLKGWGPHEPVILPQTTGVLAVLPLLPLGTPLTQQVVHRLPLFLTMTGAKAGDPLSPSHYRQIIAGNGGLLEKAGKVPLTIFFNQVESKVALQQAEDILTGLAPEIRASLAAVVAGSVQQEKGVILWQRSRKQS